MILFCFQHGLALRNHVLVVGSREEEQKEETDLKKAFRRYFATAGRTGRGAVGEGAGVTSLGQTKGGGVRLA